MNVTLKQITPTAVLMAATALILAEGCTTVLMVQQSLRNRGYLARKATVATQLREVAQRLSWQVDKNALFSVYYFPTLSIIPQ